MFDLIARPGPLGLSRQEVLNWIRIIPLVRMASISMLGGSQTLRRKKRVVASSQWLTDKIGLSAPRTNDNGQCGEVKYISSPTHSPQGIPRGERRQQPFQPGPFVAMALIFQRYPNSTSKIRRGYDLTDRPPAFEIIADDAGQPHL